MVKNGKVQFIFAGRLVKEKGFDLVLGLFDKILEQGLENQVQFHIFSDGRYRNILEYGIEKKWKSFVKYYGQKSQDEILQIWRNMHYTLIPSRFLETFGLVGLDSLSVGVPIITIAKGGLKQFVSCKDFLQNEDNLFQYIKNIITNFNIKKRKEQSLKSKKLYEKYVRSIRIKRFKNLSGLEPGAKILLVSDYIINIGGIEIFLFNVKALLEENGYIVELVGCVNKRLAYNRLVSLFGTYWNNVGVKLFRKKVKEFRPDLIWRHSIQRWFGPLVLYEARHCRAKQRVMYHDFGLFHPYPSKIYEKEQLYYSTTLSGYMKEGISLIRRQLPLQFIKWISSFLIKRQLKKIIDIHLIPSPYMKKIIQAYYPKLEKEKIQVLPHFI